MTALNIVATFKIKSEFKSEFQTEFKKIVEGSRAEAGCLQYDLHQDINDANTYVFLEKWQSQEIINQHNQTAHFKHFIAFCEGKTDSITVNVLSKVI